MLYHREVAQVRNEKPPEKQHTLKLSQSELEELITILQEDVKSKEQRFADGELPFGLLKATLLLDKCRQAKR